MRLRILTLNVQAYQTARSRAKRLRLRDLLEASGADIVALQEDLQARPAEVLPPTYTVVAQCRAERIATGFLYNTILVHDRARHWVEPLAPVDLPGNPAMVRKEQGPGRSCPNERCAAGVRIDGAVVLANVHLCGGRFVDPHYGRAGLPDVRARSLQLLVREMKPDLIVGDFNSERTEAAARRTLARHPVFRGLTAKARDAFLRYYLSGHEWLQSYGGYTPLYDEGLGSTSRYGGVPDWMYVRNSCLLAVRQAQVLDARDCSDHNAVLVDVDLLREMPITIIE